MKRSLNSLTLNPSPGGRGKRRESLRDFRGTGFSLVEVLVTLVVISIGLLGLGRLQGFGLAMNSSSHMRLKATYKAYELADRMRANQGALTSYLNSSGSRVTACTQAAGCTPVQMAQNDLYEWTADLARQLPGGVGLACVDGTPDDGSFASAQCDGIGPAAGGVYVVKVWWIDDKSGTPKRFTTTVRP